jgi:hypothetical protein
MSEDRAPYETRIQSLHDIAAAIRRECREVVDVEAMLSDLAAWGWSPVVYFVRASQIRFRGAPDPGLPAGPHWVCYPQAEAIRHWKSFRHVDLYEAVRGLWLHAREHPNAEPPLPPPPFSSRVVGPPPRTPDLQPWDAVRDLAPAPPEPDDHTLCSSYPDAPPGGRDVAAHVARTCPPSTLRALAEMSRLAARALLICQGVAHAGR